MLMETNEFKEIKNKFQTSYFKYIKPNLETFEKERKKFFKLFYFVIFPAISTIAAFLIIPIIQIKNKTGDDIEAIFTIAIFSISLIILIYGYLEKKLENKIKDKFMYAICKCFDNLSWNNRTYMNNPSEFHEIGLVNYYNRNTFDDIFYGKYKDTPFEIIEAHFRHETGSGKNRHIRTIFQGIILKIKTNKSYNSHTVVRPDALIKLGVKNLQRTELEDVVFEKKYDVYTNDEVESRVILNVGLMERLNKAKEVFEAKKIFCCFIEDKAYIGLHTCKDMFKLCSLKKNINNAEYFIKLFDEIISVYKLIDHLNLTQEKLV